MPWAAPRPCSRPGCPEQAPCPTHKATKRPSVDEQGNSLYRGKAGKRHDAWRRLVLAADPICHYPANCRLCRRWATVADHVQPISAGGARFDVGNGQGLCHAHHNTKTAQEKRGVWVDTRKGN